MKMPLLKNLHIEKKSFYFVLIVLQVITALVLGFLILQRVIGVNNSSKTNANRGTAELENETPDLSSTDLGGRWNENNILDIPEPQASEEDWQEHYKAVEKIAKEASIVELQDCQGNPVVAKVKQGSNLVFKNNDSVEHLLRKPGGPETVKIPANGEITIVANFERGPGVHFYSCDSESGTSGIIFLVRP